MPQQINAIVNSPIDCPRCGSPVEAYIHNRGAVISDPETPGGSAFLSATTSEGADETRVVGVSLASYSVESWPLGDAGVVYPCGHEMDAGQIHAVSAEFEAVRASNTPPKTSRIAFDDYLQAVRAAAGVIPCPDFAEEAVDAALDALRIEVER